MACHTIYPSVLVRKIAFVCFGRPLLSDKVRNHVYWWAWSHLRRLPGGSAIIDIGSRDSFFPSFIAWRGYSVRVVERDGRFIGLQRTNSLRWGVDLEIDNSDFSAASISLPCDAICSLFSLQHAGDRDSEAYSRAARLLRPGGLLLAAMEYCHDAMRFEYGRDDGTMRIYDDCAIAERVTAPLVAEGMVESDRRYCTVMKNGKAYDAGRNIPTATMVMVLFRKCDKGQTAGTFGRSRDVARNVSATIY